MRSYLLAGAGLLTFALPAWLNAQDTSTPSTMPSTSGSPTSPDSMANDPAMRGTMSTTRSDPSTGTPESNSAAADARNMSMDPAQRTMYDAWPADRQSDFRTLSRDEQSYVWTLTPEQQNGYWALTRDQRGMIYRMSPDQRAKAWQSVMAQMAGQTPPTPADQANPPGMGIPTTGVPNPSDAAQAVPPAMPADTGYQGGPYKGALTPPPADAMNKTYPLCTRQIQDSCRNPGEGGAPGRSRAARSKQTR